MKKILATFLSLSLAISLVACGEAKETNGSSSSTSETTETTETLGSKENTGSLDSTIVYGSGDYTRINPALDEHGEINALIFDGLMAHDGEGKTVNRLADSYEYDEESFTYTFNLNKEAKWHDGEDFTAEDVKFTFEAIMDPENGSENAPNYNDVEEITVVDPDTVSFTLAGTNAAFLEYMTMAILPKHLLEGEDMQTADYFRNPIGTGPYKLDSWEVGQAISLVKNEDYFMGPAHIDNIIFKIVPDDSAKTLQLKSGELNLSQVTPKDAETFTEENIVKYDMKTSDYRGILYNFWNEYWQKNSDLIPAISYAIDRQAMLDTILLGEGDIAYGPLQRNIYNYDGVEKYQYNPAKAEELLVAAGCIKGDDGYYYRDGEKIGFTINATAGDQVRIDMAMVAAQQLQAIGLDVDSNVPESIDWGGQECCIIGWGSPFDADDHTYKVFGTDNDANYSGYSNSKVDEFLTAARETFDSDVRKENYKNFQIELANTPAYTFFCYIDAIYMADKSIKGIDPKVVLGHHGVGIFWNVCDWTIE